MSMLYVPAGHAVLAVAVLPRPLMELLLPEAVLQHEMVGWSTTRPPAYIRLHAAMHHSMPFVAVGTMDLAVIGQDRAEELLELLV